MYKYFTCEKNRILVYLALIIVTGIVIRISAALDYWYWFDLQFPGSWDMSKMILSQDGTRYIRQAAAGLWSDSLHWSLTPYFRPPLSSFYFQALFRITEFDRIQVAAVQSLIATTGQIFLFLAISRWLGVRIALASVAVIALHPLLIYFDISFEDATLSTTLLIIAFYWIQRTIQEGRLSFAIAAGTAMALAILARSNLSIMAAAICVLYTSLLVIGRSTCVRERQPEVSSISSLYVFLIPLAVSAIIVFWCTTGSTDERLSGSVLGFNDLWGKPEHLAASLFLYLPAIWMLTLNGSRQDPIIIVFASALMGLGNLATYDFIAIHALFVLWMLRPTKTKNELHLLGRWSWVKITLGFVLPIGIVILMTGWHNFRVSGQFIPSTTTLGQNLFWGNGVDKNYLITMQGYTGAVWADADAPINILLNHVRSEFPDDSFDQSLKNYTFRNLAANPLQWIERLFQKALYHLSDYEIPRNTNFYYAQESSPFFQTPYVGYNLLIALALVFAWHHRRKPETWLWMLTFFCIWVTEIIFFNSARYRMVAIPFLIPAAIAGLLLIFEWLRLRLFDRLATSVIFIVLIFFIGKMVITDTVKNKYLAVSYYKAARMEIYRSAPEALYDFRAINESRFLEQLSTALTIDPDNLPAFYLKNVYLALREVSISDAIMARNMRCGHDDWLCLKTCKNLNYIENNLPTYKEILRGRGSTLTPQQASSSD